MLVGFFYYALGYIVLIILFYNYVENTPIEIISKIDDPLESY